MIQRSLSLRILLINFILLLLPLLLYFFFIFEYRYQNVIASAVGDLKDLAKNRALLVNEVVEKGYAVLDLLADLQGGHFESETLKKYKADTHYSELNFFEVTEGNEFIVIASSEPEKVGKNYTFREYLDQAKKDGYSAYLALHTVTNEKELFLSKSIQEKGRVVGILTAILPVSKVLKFLVNDEFAPFNVHISLLTQDGIIFVSSDPAIEIRALLPISEERLEALQKAKQFGDYKISLTFRDFDPVKPFENTYEWVVNGNERIGVKQDIVKTYFSILISAGKKDVTEKFYHHLWQIVLLVSAMALFSSFLHLWLTSKMAQPLSKLFNVMKEYGKGNLKAHFEKGPFGYEINVIGMRLNEMSEHLQKTMENEKSEEEGKELLAKELKIGREIQMSILPQEMPTISGAELSARSLPALEVGGDFYDLYVCEREGQKRLVITLGDGAGKGISACLYSLCLRSILRSYASEFHTLGKMMQMGNNLFYLDTESASMFATVATVTIDEGKKNLRFYSCGQPCLLRKKGGAIVKLSSHSVAMGVIEVERYQEQVIEMEPSDLFVFYSDGVTDAQNLDGELYGEKRLCDFLTLYGDLPCSMILDDLFKEIALFSKGTKQADDITVVLLRLGK